MSGSEPITCVQCKRELPADDGPQAGISISVMGDEYIYSYWRCDACGFYTVESYLDRFMGDSEVTFLPPIPQAVGEHCVALARQCPTPYDKTCECPAHRALYYGLPREPDPG